MLWSSPRLSNAMNDAAEAGSPIETREQLLRAWFTRGSDPLLRQIDGLDIGWGGVQRWATARMPPVEGLHVDMACGYGTFLAQLGWRFPAAQLFGLNIDFEGPHAIARPLLQRAGVSATLVRADARSVPFRTGTFDSASCFLGLQDIDIGFGDEGVRAAIGETVRVLRTAGILVLLDEFPFQRFDALLDGLPVIVTDRSERALQVHWGRGIAERAISLYAEGWAAQTRPRDPEAQEESRAAAYARMKMDMESQLEARGYYVPFGPIRMLACGRIAQ
jgi:SAM-dependent methyltransferase